MPVLLQGIRESSAIEDERLVDTVKDEIDADLDEFATVRRSVERMGGPDQQVEFVAKSLRDSETVLGTPVYVALCPQARSRPTQAP